MNLSLIHSSNLNLMFQL